MKNMIICLGGAGNNCAREIITNDNLKNIDVYAIDSVTSNVDIDTVGSIKFISLVSDENEGSGRNRARSQAMYEFHEANGDFKELYKAAKEAKVPVVVITSAAGGTGSGSCVPLCKALIDRGVKVLPIIICPNKNDPMAFHLNTNDLLIELGELDIKTYSVFENYKPGADYAATNKEIVTFIEIILGRRYSKTSLDSIDDSDLNNIIEWPGRIMAFVAEGTSVESTSREIIRKAYSGSQPGWGDKINDGTIMTAFSLKSMFANTDHELVFSELRSRFDPKNVFDEYRNIVVDDNDGKMTATVIIAGLPSPNTKDIDTEFKETSGLGNGRKKSHRPSFISSKKATISEVPVGDGSDAKAQQVIRKFKFE